MNNGLEIAQNNFLENIGRMCSAFGLNKSVVKLYAFLYLNAKPLSLDDIAEALGFSKGSVSIHIREIERWGAVRTVWVKGSRKDFYQADPDLKKVFLNKVKSTVQKRTAELSVFLDDFERSLRSMDGGVNKEDAERLALYKDRIDQIKEMRDTAFSIMKLLNKVL